MERYDAIIIGGGPAGSTLGTILAQNHRKVALFEREKFPRFHIGESLLPATSSILERLDVLEEVDKKFLHKPGGQWYYEDTTPLQSDFSKPDNYATFSAYPYAYMVERATFDEMLLRNAERKGVLVREQHIIQKLLYENRRVVGVQVYDRRLKKTSNIFGSMVFDCTGLGSFISKNLGLRKINKLKRMAVYAHYQADFIDPKLTSGWFVGGMVPDGWVWTIPLAKNKVSIGLVMPTDQHMKVNGNADAFLDNAVANVGYFKSKIKNASRISPVTSTGNVGFTSKQFHGEGWALVGDAAFFIDPCYSSGVHLAMKSAQEAADIFLKHSAADPVPATAYNKYAKNLRQYEKTVNRLVASFYMATNNSWFRKWVPAINNPYFDKKFATLTGGDFHVNHAHVNSLYFTGKLFDLLFPKEKKKAQVRKEQFYAKLTAKMKARGIDDFADKQITVTI